MTIFDDILRSTRRRVAAAKASANLDQLAESAREARLNAEPHQFWSAIERTGRLNVIAEFKKASPSKGAINSSADPAATARAYERGGAAAISVLTEPDNFQGSLDDLRTVRGAVSIPVLRKDFIVDEFQIFEAAKAGADAILLIAAALSVDELQTLRRLVEDDLGMDALVEVHSQMEMAMATDAGATLIGVNNRNLKTFAVSLDVSRELIEFAPTGSILVAESGLASRGDLEELAALGYSGFLIGEALMRSGDIETSLADLVDG